VKIPHLVGATGGQFGAVLLRQARMRRTHLNGRECEEGTAALIEDTVPDSRQDIAKRMRSHGDATFKGRNDDEETWTYRPAGGSQTYEVLLPAGPDAEFVITVKRFRALFPLGY
jgi:hypothetical protein